MFNFNRGLNKTEKLNLMEYLSFQLKTGTSFKSAIQRYVDTPRSKKMYEVCSSLVELINNGEKPADALYKLDLLTNIEYTLVANASNNYEALKLITEQAYRTKSSADTLKSSIKSGLFLLIGLLLLIPIFRKDIEGIYLMFAQMGGMASGVTSAPQIPFLVKYWWSVFIVIGVIFLIYMALNFFLKWLYFNKGNIYYMIFGYKVNEDLVSLVTTLNQMSKIMSLSQAYSNLEKNAPNLYWRDVFQRVNYHIKHGGKASQVFLEEKKIIPLEVIYCFIDGEDTGESDIYFQKAIEYSQNSFIKSQEMFKTIIPAFFDIFVYFLIGLVAIKFTDDMNNLGVMKIITQIK